MPLTSGTTLGPYEILSPIGAGGMREVYKARDTRLDRTVAIKVLPEHVAADPDLKQRFEREAKTISSLNHPHICTLYDIGESGYPDLHNIMPNLMYRSRNGASFKDVTYTGGFGHIQKGHAVVFADLDHDGDQDIFEQMGGAYPIDGFTNVLYENPGFGNHWITVTLVGVRSNRSAIGARLRLEIVDDGVRRSIFRHVNSGGSFGANPLRQTIGLGQAPRIETLDVFWPMTGETQTFQSLSVDQVIEIVEGRSCVHDRPGRDVPSGRRVTYLTTVKSALHSCGPHTSRNRPWSGAIIATDADSGRDESLIESPIKFDCE